MATTITKTIGTGGDYSTLALWISACPPNLVAVDQIWQGKLKNQTFSGTAVMLNISGITTDATRYVELTTEAGASFRDAPNPILRCDPTQGALITSSVGYDAVILCDVAYTRFVGLQIENTTSASNYGRAISALGVGTTIESCICEAKSGVWGSGTVKMGGGKMLNSVVVCRAGGESDLFTTNVGGATICNSVLAMSGGLAPAECAIRCDYATVTIKNSVILGAKALIDGSGTITNGGGNFTSLAGNPSGFTTVAYDAALIAGPTDAARDFKPVAGSALIDKVTADTTLAPKDIVGTTRPTGAGQADAGAWEFSVGGGGDTTPPTLTGTITVSAKTTTSYTISWPAGSDNVAVTGYEYSLDGGTTYTDAGNVLTKGITGRTPGATDQVRVRAYDAAGNKSTPPLSVSVTLDSAPAVTLTTQPLKNNTGALLASQTGATAHVYQTTGALVVTKTGQTTNSSGVMTITDAALVSGATYRVVIVLASGAEGMDRITAA